jgi:hypothetical protein
MEQLRKRITNGRPRNQIQVIIDDWIIGENGARNRKIIETYLFDGLSLEEIAGQFCMSTQGVCDVIYPKCNFIYSKLTEANKDITTT